MAVATTMATARAMAMAIARAMAMARATARVRATAAVPSLISLQVFKRLLSLLICSVVDLVFHNEFV